jgi:hypothetical protein
VQLQRHQNAQESLNRLECAIVESASLIPKDGDAVKLWLGKRQEMLARLELLKAMNELEHVSPLVKTQKEFGTICNVYDSLCLSLDHSPQTPSQMPSVHQVDGLHLLKCILSWCKSSDLESKVYTESSLLNTSDFKKAIFIPTFEVHQGTGSTILGKLESLDTVDLYLSAMADAPYDLVRVVNIAFWCFPDQRLSKILMHLFPTLGDKENPTMNSSPRKQQELKRTPTLLDLEVFLVLLILERQLSLIQHYHPGTDGELLLSLAHSHPWQPPAPAISFWKYIVSHFGAHSKTSKIQHPYSSMKLSNALDELRGIGKKNWKHLFGLLAISYSKLENRESDTKAFALLFESLKSGTRASGPSVLFGNAFDLVDSSLE